MEIERGRGSGMNRKVCIETAEVVLLRYTKYVTIRSRIAIDSKPHA